MPVVHKHTYGRGDVTYEVNSIAVDAVTFVPPAPPVALLPKPSDAPVRGAPMRFATITAKIDRREATDRVPMSHLSKKFDFKGRSSARRYDPGTSADLTATGC